MRKTEQPWAKVGLTRVNIMKCFPRSFLLAWLLAAAASRAASPNAARALGDAIADAVDKAMPAVVVVRTEAVVIHRAIDPFFGDIYGIPERLAGQGSGVVITKEGHILTSYHVVRAAGRVQVAFSNGTQYDAQLIGYDGWTDVAVLKVQAPKDTAFHPIEIGDSDALRIGEFVIAIGSPFSLDSSVTLGVVSQKGRSVGMLPYEDFIQTDAPINPGNSGGPLIDVEGRMVGLNAAIQTGSPMARGNIGIGFAVPVGLAMRVANSLIKTGRADRPWIGVKLRDRATPSSGDAAVVEIADVVEGAPAEAAGLKAGDIIETVDGKSVSATRAVQRAVFQHAVGDTVKLRVQRAGRHLDFEIVTVAMPQEM
jgi:S1-C subfamily serine protease